MLRRSGARIVKIRGMLQIRRPEIPDHLPVQIEYQGIVQRPHGLSIEHIDLLCRVPLPFFQLRPDLMDRILGLLLQTEPGNWVEKNPGVPAHVVHTLPAGQKSGPVPLLLLLVRLIGYGTALAFGGFNYAFLPQPQKRRPDGQGVHLKLPADILDGRKLFSRKKIAE